MKQLAILTFLFFIAGNAFADYAVRYSANYGRFDRTFSSRYSSYSESTSIYQDCGYYTCIDSYTTSSRVHIEETVMESGTYSGYTKVSVYKSESYTTKHVDYYTHRGQVVHRRYYGSHPRYGRQHRYYGHYHNHYRHRLYSSYNFSNLSTEMQLILVGTEFVLEGASTAVHCTHIKDETSRNVCYGIAAAEAAAGLASSISASIIAANKKSELQKDIIAAKDADDDDDLFSNFDD